MTRSTVTSLVSPPPPPPPLRLMAQSSDCANVMRVRKLCCDSNCLYVVLSITAAAPPTDPDVAALQASPLIARFSHWRSTGARARRTRHGRVRRAAPGGSSSS